MARKRSTKFDDLLRTLERYYRESENCKRGKAFLAGCVIQGAILEASLTLMALVYRDSVSKTRTFGTVKQRVRRRGGRSVRWLRDFNLADLEKVAIQLGWATGLENDLKKLRDTRNLVHPGKYAEETGKRVPISNRYYQSQYKKLAKITDKLYKKLIQSLTLAWKKEHPWV